MLKPTWVGVTVFGTCLFSSEGKITESDHRDAAEVNSSDIGYKPSVDITLNSLSQIYGGDTLAVILTGMGADGREGCRTLKSLGAKIWAQDKDSSVVYGMPQAVTVDRLAEVNIDINDIGECIKTEMS